MVALLHSDRSKATMLRSHQTGAAASSWGGAPVREMGVAPSPGHRTQEPVRPHTGKRARTQVTTSVRARLPVCGGR
jgi:hypothetical protein